MFPFVKMVEKQGSVLVPVNLNISLQSAMALLTERNTKQNAQRVKASSNQGFHILINNFAANNSGFLYGLKNA